MIYLEGIALIIILLLQMKNYYRSLMEISDLHRLFPSGELSPDSIVQKEVQGSYVDQLSISHNNGAFETILSATNAYLSKNKGSADFNIIKSIADRSVESQENKVSSSLSLPLYLGLMGTFIGVILGLASVAIDGFNLNNTDVIIKELIRGVVLAMIVSLFGLALTTNLNARIFKNAVAIRDVHRNRYLNFLQAELLPNLDNNLYSALDQFRSNIADFNAKFGKNLEIFDTSFNENIKNLRATVTGMAAQIAAVNENTAVQLEFLQELKKIGYNRMAEANMKVFDKIKEVGPTLVTFIAEQQKLTKNLEQANVFSERISGLIDRVSHFEEGINNLGRDLKLSDLLGGEMLGVVKKHLTAIEQKEYLINDYAARSGNEVEGYLNAGLERIKTLRNKIEIDFEKAFDFNAENNLMQNLSYLKVIGQNTAGLNDRLEEHNTRKLEEKFDVLISLIERNNTKVGVAQEGQSGSGANKWKAVPKEKPRKWWEKLMKKQRAA